MKAGKDAGNDGHGSREQEVNMRLSMVKAATRWRRAGLAGLLVLAIWSPAGAVDGVIEINDVRAQAGGVTPGDTPGYPVTVGQPGSYRLTGQLFVSGTNIDVLVITADHVTLDLNGFQIRCLYAFETCVAQGGTGVGIRSTGSNVEIRNGIVRDMPAAGIVLGARSRLDGLRVLDNGSGVSMPNPGSIEHSLISGNAGHGIEIQSFGTVILSSVISGNGGYGIHNDVAFFAYAHNSIFFNGMGSVLTPSNGLQTAGNQCGFAACP